MFWQSLSFFLLLILVSIKQFFLLKMDYKLDQGWLEQMDLTREWPKPYMYFWRDREQHVNINIYVLFFPILGYHVFQILLTTQLRVQSVDVENWSSEIG